MHYKYLCRLHWEYLLLCTFYAFLKFGSILAIDNFVDLIIPLNLFYAGKIIFSGFHPAPDLAETVIAPANIGLIYPPGISIFSNLLGSIQNAFYFAFALQALVPLLSYRLIRIYLPRIYSLLLALVIAYHGTSANSWYPDFLIQPFCLLALLLFVMPKTREKLPSLVVTGLLVGLVITLKHNIGIFFAVCCGTLLFFHSTGMQKINDSMRSFPYFCIVGFLLFGFFFALRLPHADEVFFFLLPYFLFWIFILKIFLQKRIFLDNKLFLKRAFVFGISTLLFPFFLFFEFANVIGFDRYSYSLLGMGFDYIKFWDSGIINITKGYIRDEDWRAFLSSTINATLILSPFFINCFATGKVLFLSSHKFDAKLPEQLAITAFGVCGAFMLFPLEDLKISASKFSFFLIVLAANWYPKNRITSIGILMLILAMMTPTPSAFRRAVAAFKTNSVVYTKISEPFNSLINIAMHPAIAKELGTQLDVLTKTIDNKTYLALNTPSYNLTTLLYLLPPPKPQYYLRFDPNAVNDAVINKVKIELKNTCFVVAASEDIRVLKEKTLDAAMNTLLQQVSTEFEEVTEYVNNSTTESAVKHIDDFIVFRRKDKNLEFCK